MVLPFTCLIGLQKITVLPEFQKLFPTKCLTYFTQWLQRKEIWNFLLKHSRSFEKILKKFLKNFNELREF